MIQGTLGDEGELLFEISLITDNGFELPVDALLDTGFSGWLAMNDQDLDGLDWTYVKQEKMRTAKGEFNFDLYVGKVRIEEREFDIPVHVGAGVPEILICRQLLKNRRLVVDISAGVLTLEAS
ncbi:MULTISPECIES: aspartyl protease [unclassified Microcoleus]|uniref:aspartyl protease n=1 Tax=unclassified Microcoleus TaxID=2642155 RepID=UPI002FD34EFB